MIGCELVKLPITIREYSSKRLDVHCKVSTMRLLCFKRRPISGSQNRKKRRVNKADAVGFAELKSAIAFSLKPH